MLHDKIVALGLLAWHLRMSQDPHADLQEDAIIFLDAIAGDQNLDQEERGKDDKRTDESPRQAGGLGLCP